MKKFYMSLKKHIYDHSFVVNPVFRHKRFQRMWGPSSAYYLNWDSSRANYLSKAGQNSNIFKGFLSKAGQNSNSQTENHTLPQEQAHTSMLTLHCSDESQYSHTLYAYCIHVIVNRLLIIVKS